MKKPPRAAERCRKLGVSQTAFCHWKKNYVSMGVAERRRVKQLEEENRQRTQVVADPLLDNFVDKKAPYLQIVVMSHVTRECPEGTLTMMAACSGLLRWSPIGLATTGIA
jgi:hypothetical protein